MKFRLAPDVGIVKLDSTKLNRLNAGFCTCTPETEPNVAKKFKTKLSDPIPFQMLSSKTDKIQYPSELIKMLKCGGFEPAAKSMLTSW